MVVWVVKKHLLKNLRNAFEKEKSKIPTSIIIGNRTTDGIAELSTLLSK